MLLLIRSLCFVPSTGVASQFWCGHLKILGSTEFPSMDYEADDQAEISGEGNGQGSRMEADSGGGNSSGQNQRHPVPSLVDLSMSVLASYSEFVSSLDHVPDEMREKLSRFVCEYRKMDTNFMRLLVAGSPQQIIVKDCSWMTVEQFDEIFRNCDVKNLRVLHLELCCNCMFDSTLSDAFGGSPAKFCALASLSLKGAAGLTDEGLKSLTLLAPSLKSINLSLCSLITADGIDTIASAYKLTLKELYLDECPQINALFMWPALMELKTLEVLSLAGIHRVTDGFLGPIARVCGSNMKELRLADCGDEALGAFLKLSGQSLTELSLNGISKVGPCTASSIARYTRDLQILDLSWCRSISNEMLGLIVDSCRSLRLLKLFGCTQCFWWFWGRSVPWLCGMEKDVEVLSSKLKGELAVSVKKEVSKKVEDEFKWVVVIRLSNGRAFNALALVAAMRRAWNIKRELCFQEMALNRVVIKLISEEE
ncbi:hypothetical protein QQ045_030646 [Rhodiola kirilowii]